MKLTTDRHEALRDLFATAELLVVLHVMSPPSIVLCLGWVIVLACIIALCIVLIILVLLWRRFVCCSRLFRHEQFNKLDTEITGTPTVCIVLLSSELFNSKNNNNNNNQYIYKQRQSHAMSQRRWLATAVIFRPSDMSLGFAET